MLTRKKMKSDAKYSKTKKNITFEYFSSEAKEISLAGSFNQWNTQANPMKKNIKGIWKAALSLEPGRYEYRLYVDGNWENDHSCSEFVANEFGGQNCVRIVT